MKLALTIIFILSNIKNLSVFVIIVESSLHFEWICMHMKKYFNNDTPSKDGGC